MSSSPSSSTCGCMKAFGSPERYIQGPRVTKRLGAEMRRLGIKGPVVVLSSGSPRRLLETTWTTSLQESGYEFTSIAFGGLCTKHEAQRIYEAAQQAGATTIIAFGGGGVIDAGRAATFLADDLEFISCPTVASTDAPCSALSVIYNADHSLQEARLFRRHPVLVVVDTWVIARSPKRTLVGGLGDALATWFESRSCREAHNNNILGGQITMAGAALAELSYQILIEDGAAAVSALDAQTVTPALERVVEANTLLSGIGFESGGLCVAHSVHTGLTTQPECADYTHGEKVAFGLCTQLVLEGRPRDEILTVLGFCKKVGLPVTLKEVGVDCANDKAIKEIAEGALRPGQAAHNEPFVVTQEMMEDAIRAADHMGTNYLQGIEI